jgi:hypothetical protein
LNQSDWDHVTEPRKSPTPSQTRFAIDEIERSSGSDQSNDDDVSIHSDENRLLTQKCGLVGGFFPASWPWSRLFTLELMAVSSHRLAGAYFDSLCWTAQIPFSRLITNSIIFNWFWKTWTELDHFPDNIIRLIGTKTDRDGGFNESNPG